jgi:hypothetical protein
MNPVHCEKVIEKMVRDLEAQNIYVDFDDPRANSTDSMTIYNENERQIGLSAKLAKIGRWAQLAGLRHAHVHAKILDLAEKGIEHPLLGQIADSKADDPKAGYIQKNIDDALAYYQDAFTLKSFLDWYRIPPETLSPALLDSVEKAERLARDNIYLAEETLRNIETHGDGYLRPLRFIEYQLAEKSIVIATEWFYPTHVNLQLPLLKSNGPQDSKNLDYFKERLITMNEFSQKLILTIEKEFPSELFLVKELRCIARELQKANNLFRTREEQISQAVGSRMIDEILAEGGYEDKK